MQQMIIINKMMLKLLYTGSYNYLSFRALVLCQAVSQNLCKAKPFCKVYLSILCLCRKMHLILIWIFLLLWTKVIEASLCAHVDRSSRTKVLSEEGVQKWALKKRKRGLHPDSRFLLRIILSLIILWWCDVM